MTKELTVREQGTFALTAQEVVDVAVEQSRLLMSIVEQTKCYQNIAGKKYLQVEAWETIGAFNRTHAETKSITPILRDNEIIGYQAHVQLWKDGVTVGGAIMPAFFSENCCKGKEGDAKHKAAMSASQTFATSKAYRMNYSHVAILAGYQPLPAEEITEDINQLAQPQKKEHWCELHQTNFFMKGKMKSYAHPIGDTSEWCHERKEKPKAKTAVKAKPVDIAEGIFPEPDVPTTGDVSATPHSNLGPAPAHSLGLLSLTFKDAGEFKAACVKYLDWKAHEVTQLISKEVPEYDLSRDTQRADAWQTLVALYKKEQ